jgi:hypothetical protein
MAREASPTGAWLFQALLLDATISYTGRGGLAAALSIKLTEVFYVPRVRQWFPILHSQADASTAADLGHLKRSLPPGGELVGSLPSEHPLEHQIIHPELSAMHKLLLIAPERLVIPCIFYSRLPSSFINKVNIFTPELILCGLVICLDTKGAHGDFWGEDGLSPIHQKERRFSGGPTG